jgi:hypothetical protein
MKPRAIYLHQIRDNARRDDARRVRRRLFDCARNAAEQLEDEICGFALVTWGHDGELRSAYEASAGPIRWSLVPTLAADALNRHISVMMVEQKARDEAEG